MSGGAPNALLNTWKHGAKLAGRKDKPSEEAQEAEKRGETIGVSKESSQQPARQRSALQIARQAVRRVQLQRAEEAV